MAMAAAVGPPPGLTAAHDKGTRDSKAPTSFSSNPDATSPTGTHTTAATIRKTSGGGGADGSKAPPQLIKMCAPKSSRYETRFMLALSSSPLVAPPPSMPPLQQWYGDWEPYHFRAPHGSQGHGLPYSPMGSIGSGTRAERHGRGAGGGDYHRDHKDRNGEDADGYYGGVMRDGGLTSSRRGEQGGRFRNRYDEREGDLGPLRVGDAGKRFPSSGKNPFGQVSASGTFKPAGKDGLEAGLDKKFGPGRRGERDMPSHAYPDDRNKGIRNGRDGAGTRRRGAHEEADDDDEWESVPRSPEYERRNKSAGIEGAMEWRRTPGGKLGGKAAPLSARERERESGRKTSFPSWMTEETEPSWMNEGQDDGQQYQMGGGGRDGPSRKGDDHDDIEVDVTGMDGIQAFKAQMKERERRERERNQGGTSTAVLSAGPPPGLAKRQQDGDDQESKRDGAAALHSVGMGQSADKSSAALFDNFASSAKQRAQEKQQQQAQNQDPRAEVSSSKEEGEIGGVGGADQVQPSRSSRFARFFDGKPQAAALAAQQRQMEASQRGGAEESPAGSVHLPASPQGREGGSASLADLFKGMGTDNKAGGGEGKSNTATAPPAPPGLQRNPSEADVQSMQKIMALLSGGGGAPKGAQEDPHAAAHSRSGPPGAPPPMPPGIGVGAGGQSGEREKGGQQTKPNPTTPQQHAPPPPPPGVPASWANAVTSPRQQYDNHLGQYPTSPPPNSQQQQGGPPFRPPFGMDPRMLARGPPLPQGMLPQFGGAGGMPPPPPPPMGRNFDMPPFPPGARPPPPMPPLPPQLQQHMMTLPPQAQHQLLMQHLQHHGLAHNAFGGPPPPPQQQQHHHMTSPGQHHAGNAGVSPLPPFMSPSPASSNAAQSAQLMALLGQGPGGGNNNNSGN